ncbi:hypothetical protein LNP74_29400 [Klebsiella pneumoniae subsp. pneumoniae]|nr:hypothetical protein [Klebsiella pneumoniae subsp. pneumoniae]
MPANSQPWLVQEAWRWRRWRSRSPRSVSGQYPLSLSAVGHPRSICRQEKG